MSRSRQRATIVRFPRQPRPVIEQLLAALVAVACALLLLRLAVGPVRRARIDAALQRRWRTLRGLWFALRHRRQVRKVAEREAHEAIERARRAGEWDGNVYRPKSFRRPKKPH